MERSAPGRQVQKERNAGTAVRLFTFAHPPGKRGLNSKPSKTGCFNPLVSGKHPILHEDQENRGSSPESKTKQGVVTCETSPRLAQKLGGSPSVRVRGVAYFNSTPLWSSLRAHESQYGYMPDRHQSRGGRWRCKGTASDLLALFEGRLRRATLIPNLSLDAF